MKKIYAIGILITVFILSTIKIGVAPPDNSDKLVHIIMYFFVAMSFYFLNFRNYILWAILYGVGIEFVQYFLPYRSCSFWDAVANSIGALIFFFINRYFLKLKAY